jgi:hypothetical protein
MASGRHFTDRYPLGMPLAGYRCTSASVGSEFDKLAVCVFTMVASVLDSFDVLNAHGCALCSEYYIGLICSNRFDTSTDAPPPEAITVYTPVHRFRLCARAFGPILFSGTARDTAAPPRPFGALFVCFLPSAFEQSAFEREKITCYRLKVPSLFVAPVNRALFGDAPRFISGPKLKHYSFPTVD